MQDKIQADGTLEGKLKLEIDLRVWSVRLPKCRVPLALVYPPEEELATPMKLAQSGSAA